ncbi:MAG: hypothetical protein M3Y23_05075, partial [Actinomycetota bacterium]|nr:hypothetical protein [Actinomycetota bacterium]
MTTRGERKMLVRDQVDGVSERMVTVTPAVARLLPVDVCRQHHVIPIEYSDGYVTVVGTTDADTDAADAIRKATGYEPRWVIADWSEIDSAINGMFADGRVVVDAGSAEGAKFSAEDLVSHGLAIPPRLGEQLAGRGLVTEKQLGEAVAEQQQSGGRIGEVLVHGGALEEQALLRVLSEQLHLPMIDLTEFDHTQAPREVIPEPLARRLHIVPIAVDGRNVFIAVPDALSDDAKAEIERCSNLEVQQFLAPRNDIDDLLRRIHSDEYTRTARSNLRERFPASSAHLVLTSAQKVFFIVAALAILGFLVWKFVGTLVVIFALASIFYTLTSLYKLVAGFSALEHRYQLETSPEMLAALDERDLPVYTILVPLFDEAAAIPYLVEGINSLDYPK